MDSLPTHKVSSVCEQIEIVGARPPRPTSARSGEPTIDRSIADPSAGLCKAKALLRSAAVRIIPGLWDAIQPSLNHFAPAECRAYLAAAGYDAA
jgi:hypothetical protein